MSKTWAWVVGSGLFLALSVADFVQTYALLQGGTVVEANPVAAEWLARHGWVGLAAFKGALTLTVFLVVVLLARRRSPAAGRVLALGCAVLLGVAVYSRGLVTAERAEAEFEAAGVMVEVFPADPRWASQMAPADRS